MKKLLSALSLTTATMTLAPAAVQAAPLDAGQQQQVRELIRSTLVENPDILVEAINELRKQELEAQQNAQKAGLDARQAELFDNPNDPIIGNPKGKLSLVYFSDYNCSFCKRQEPVLEQMVNTYPELKIIFKELPVLGESSREAAEMALAAYALDKKKYHQLHLRLMSKTGGPHDSNSIAAALRAEGFDVEAVRKKITPAIKAQVDNNLRLSSELGIRGTPALVFKDEILGGFTQADALSGQIKKRLR